jgi:hypothetical protein
MLALTVQAKEPRVHEATCGGARFTVTSVNNGHPLDNTFVLSVDAPSGAQVLFTSEEGGWLDAACLEDAKGRPVLVFQARCGGSTCLEGRYGVADPRTRKILLRPGPGNVENHEALAALLGKPAPRLEDLKEAFCCSDE